MTTVIGMAHEKAEMAILCADRQGTIGDGRNQRIPVLKDLGGRKLQVSKDGQFAFAHSGLRDKMLEEFALKMAEGEVDFRKIIEQGYFSDLRELNLARLGKHVPNLDDLSGFLLITRFDNKPCLYTCFPFGAVEQRNLTYIGSGSRKVEEYFTAIATLQQARDYLKKDDDKIADREVMIRLGLEALRYAQNKDPYSSGLDLVIATPSGIVDHFNDLQEDFAARLANISSIYKEVNGSKPK